MKNKLSLSLIVTALLVTSTTVFANAKEAKVQHKEAQAKVAESIYQENYLAKVESGTFEKEANLDETKRLHGVISKIVKEHKESIKSIHKEFMSGLNSTVKALQAIKMGKTDDAKKLLAQADKDFTVAFKKEPNLGLIPVRDNLNVVSFNGSVELIKHIKNSAIKLLQDNDTQAAIAILSPLEDEIVMRTESVPAYLYPIAVKKASKELQAGKSKDAFNKQIKAIKKEIKGKNIVVKMYDKLLKDFKLLGTKEKNDKK